MKSVSNLILSDHVVCGFTTSSSGLRCRITLGDDTTLTLLQTIFAWSKGNLLNLSPRRMYKAREVCGLENWNSMPRSRSLRSCAGMCLAFLAQSEALPLAIHRTKSGKGSKHYWPQLAQPFAVTPPAALQKSAVRSGKDIVVYRP